MIRRFRCPESAKKEYVAEVLAGYRIEFVARRYGMHPATLCRWVREYEDKVGDVMARKRLDEATIQEKAMKFEELQQKYEEALKLLGEKDVEIRILAEQVKKKYPNWKSPYTG